MKNFKDHFVDVYLFIILNNKSRIANRYFKNNSFLSDIEINIL